MVREFSRILPGKRRPESRVKTLVFARSVKGLDAMGLIRTSTRRVGFLSRKPGGVRRCQAKAWNNAVASGGVNAKSATAATPGKDGVSQRRPPKGDAYDVSPVIAPGSKSKFRVRRRAPPSRHHGFQFAAQ